MQEPSQPIDRHIKTNSSSFGASTIPSQATHKTSTAAAQLSRFRTVSHCSSALVEQLGDVKGALEHPIHFFSIEAQSGIGLICGVANSLAHECSHLSRASSDPLGHILWQKFALSLHHSNHRLTCFELGLDPEQLRCGLIGKLETGSLLFFSSLRLFCCILLGETYLTPTQQKF